jgi:hypothetical protein
VIRGLANAPAGVYVVGARPNLVNMAPVIQRVHSRAPHCATSFCTRALRSDIPGSRRSGKMSPGARNWGVRSKHAATS